MFRFPFFQIPRLLLGMFDEVFMVALVVVAIVLLVRWANRPRGAAPEAPPDEREIMNQLARSMEKMERRLENLETILLEHESRRK